ncbi:MAG: hypothetical protein QNK83_14435 [Akkermansiaceae bacterium]
MVLRLALFLSCTLPLLAQENWRAAPDLSHKPINQLRTSGNACGPACLLEAFQSGSEKWQQSAAVITGDTQRARLLKIIKGHGARASKVNPKRRRWDQRGGINAEDLAIIANEMRTRSWMGTAKQELFFKGSRETQAKLLKRAHADLRNSLKKGLPPIMSIRRVALRQPPGSAIPSWLTLKRHYAVLTGLPESLPKNATSFAVSYRDPWGGYSCTGIVRIATQPETGIATLILDFPKSTMGKDLVRKNENSALSFSSAIGLF